MKKIITYIIILCALLPLHTHAQKYTLLEPLPCIPDAGVTCTEGQTIKEIDIVGFVGYVFKFSIALSAFLAELMIMWGGFEYMTSETPFGKSDGKDRITNAIVGLLGILSSYLILATIDPRLVEIYTDIPTIKIDTRDAISFQNQLNSQMSSFGDEIRLESLRLETEIKKNEDKIKGFEAQEEAIGLSEAEQKEYEQLKNETKNIKSQQINTIADGAMNIQLKIALENASSNTFTDDKSAQARVADALLVINKQYDTYSLKLREINDPAAETELYLKKNFYVDQIYREKSLSELLQKNKESDLRFSTQLESVQKEYASKLEELEDPPRSEDEASGKKQDQALKDLHISILKNRLDRIQKALKK